MSTVERALEDKRGQEERVGDFKRVLHKAKAVIQTLRGDNEWYAVRLDKQYGLKRATAMKEEEVAKRRGFKNKEKIDRRSSSEESEESLTDFSYEDLYTKKRGVHKTDQLSNNQLTFKGAKDVSEQIEALAGAENIKTCNAEVQTNISLVSDSSDKIYESQEIFKETKDKPTNGDVKNKAIKIVKMSDIIKDRSQTRKNERSLVRAQGMKQIERPKGIHTNHLLINSISKCFRRSARTWDRGGSSACNGNYSRNYRRGQSISMRTKIKDERYQRLHRNG